MNMCIPARKRVWYEYDGVDSIWVKSKYPSFVTTLILIMLKFYGKLFLGSQEKMESPKTLHCYKAC